MGHFVYLMSCFIFVTEKKHNFQKNDHIVLVYLRKRKKPNLSELTQVFCGLLSLFCSIVKIKCISATLCNCCLVSSHNAIYFPLERERVA